jgi:hypothetical protein
LTLSLATAVAALSVGAGVSFWIERAAGPSIELFTLVLLLIAVLAPLTAGPGRSAVWDLVIAGLFSIGAMSAWFWVAYLGGIDWAGTARAAAVGLCLGLSLAGISRLLSAAAGRRILGHVWPGAISILGLCWITWPVWLSVPLEGQRLVKSVAVQPLFAANSAVQGLGLWVEQPLAYPLTSFGQDVQFRMPRSVWPAILLHGGVAIVTWGVAIALDLRRPRRRPPAGPPA